MQIVVAVFAADEGIQIVMAGSLMPATDDVMHDESAAATPLDLANLIPLVGSFSPLGIRRREP